MNLAIEAHEDPALHFFTPSLLHCLLTMSLVC
jgi:hypothetical protein